MKATFLIDLDVESDTDFLGVAEDLKDSINSHFPYACLSAKPWARAATLPTLLTPPGQTSGGTIPPQQT